MSGSVESEVPGPAGDVGAAGRGAEPGEAVTSVIVVSHNTAELLGRCLSSVAAAARHTEVEIIVVDNASSDGSAELVDRDFPDARLIAVGENLGFARAVNLAVASAVGRYLLLLNPDAILHPDTIDNLVSFAEANRARSVLGGRAFEPDGTPDPRAGWALPTPWSLLCFGTGLSTAFARSATFDPEAAPATTSGEVTEVGAVSGALLFVRHDLWDEVGGFDPDYFMYSEDIDFCLRARSFGCRPAVVPHAGITHAAGASSTAPAKMVLVMKGKATYLRKHWAGPRLCFGLAMLWCGAALRALIDRLRRRLRPGAVGTVWPHVFSERATWLGGYPPARSES
ncbi:MAG: hypothetical protein JJLCMIEE_02317 [Acidimicrobiales bacterium]|nr:MAG: glycosyltransferase family 2 protein [Actinomycetota bacterium]MBV6509248.1 hypothetical protein [Acidimicrobiales bacterium]RIK04023.1 MAG: glycosyl transferase [Acidobacteriota bacterium]